MTTRTEPLDTALLRAKSISDTAALVLIATQQLADPNGFVGAPPNEIAQHLNRIARRQRKAGSGYELTGTAYRVHHVEWALDELVRSGLMPSRETVRPAAASASTHNKVEVARLLERKRALGTAGLLTPHPAMRGAEAERDFTRIVCGLYGYDMMPAVMVPTGELLRDEEEDAVLVEGSPVRFESLRPNYSLMAGWIRGREPKHTVLDVLEAGFKARRSGFPEQLAGLPLRTQCERARSYLIAVLGGASPEYFEVEETAFTTSI